MIRFLFALVVFCFLVNGADAALPHSVDVNLGVSQKPVSELFVFGPLQICGSQTLSLGEGRYSLKAQNNLLRLSSTKKVFCTARQIELKGLRNGYLKIERGRAIRTYPGIVIASAVQNNLMLVNRVTRAEYVAGVCAAELPRGARLEAIKAQAILINCMLAKSGVHAAFDDTTQNAAYIGVAIDRPELKVATREIGDSLLRYSGQVIHPYFHSTCAGRTSRACDIFQIEDRVYPYFEAVDCHYCKQSPFWKHTVSAIPWAEYRRTFGSLVPSIDNKDAGGRAVKISVNGGSKSAYDFWMKLGQKFGWNIAPGNILAFSRKGDYLEVDSRGGGHGVGMCQWGAIGMAEEGKTHVEILHHYFPLCQLSK